MGAGAGGRIVWHCTGNPDRPKYSHLLKHKKHFDSNSTRTKKEKKKKSSTTHAKLSGDSSELSRLTRLAEALQWSSWASSFVKTPHLHFCLLLVSLLNKLRWNNRVKCQFGSSVQAEIGQRHIHIVTILTHHTLKQWFSKWGSLRVFQGGPQQKRNNLFPL